MKFEIERESIGEGELAELARALAEVLIPGDVVVLSGEIGAGKTTFVRAAAKALGVAEEVTSPTYQLARSYPAERGEEKFAVEHLDLYRLQGLDPYDALDLDEHLRPDAIAFIEWADPALELLDDPSVILLSHGDGPTRDIRLGGPAARRAARRLTDSGGA